MGRAVRLSSINKLRVITGAATSADFTARDQAKNPAAPAAQGKTPPLRVPGRAGGVLAWLKTA
jgi:hypothetical protein